MYRLLFLFFLAMAAAQAAEPPALTIHYFRAEGCPHCEDAGAFFARLAAEEPRIAVRDYEVSRDAANRVLFQSALDALGVAEGGVPFILVGDWATLGYHTDATTGAEIRRQVARCLAASCPDALAAIREGRAPAAQTPREAGADLLRLPLLGEIDAAALSLPLLTLTLAGLDAFNPCAFFVLLFLLSMMAHQKSRARMLAVGGIFVLFSGLIYFAFMAAWLNLFQLLGQLAWVTLAAGLLAVVVGAANVKDFFLPGRGVSLSIPESRKPDLFRRARAILAATVFLAVAGRALPVSCFLQPGLRAAAGRHRPRLRSHARREEARRSRRPPAETAVRDDDAGTRRAAARRAGMGEPPRRRLRPAGAGSRRDLDRRAADARACVGRASARLRRLIVVSCRAEARPTLPASARRAPPGRSRCRR